MNLSTLSARTSPEDRAKNINFLRVLYSLFALQLLIAIIWTSFALSYYDKFGRGIERWWQFAIVTGVLCLILILASILVPALRRFPIGAAIYAVFTLCFMHFVSYLCLIDKSYLVYYALWLLFAVAVGFAIYAWSLTDRVNTLISIMVVMGSALLIFIVFLIFTEIKFIGLLLVLLGVLVFGFYLNYDVRRMVRGGIAEYSTDDPYTGAVRIWLEAVLVFCRFIELLGRGCCKGRH